MSATWPRVRLGDVLHERRETPDTKLLALGKMRIVSKIGFERGHIELRQEVGTKTGMILVRPGDLLLSGINAAKGAIAIYGADNTEPVAATIHYGAYLPTKNRVDTKYLWWYLRSNPFREILRQSLPQGIKTELKSKRLLPIEIPLPSLAEQRRIVARIEAIAAQVAEARSLRHEATEEVGALGPGVAVNLFEGMTFPKRPLNEVADKRTGIAYKAEDFEEAGDVPVVRLKEIGTKRPTVYLRNPDEYPNVWLEPGDIVLAKTSFSTGAMCQWPGPRAVLNQNAVMLRAKAEVEQGYLFAWLGQQVSRYLSDHLADPKFYPYIREADLMRWEVPLPSLPEQRRITAYLDSLHVQVDMLNRLQIQTASELAALLPAILDRAFKGEL